MGQTTEECLAFLENARQALQELTVLEEQKKQLEQEEQRSGKAWETAKKAMADTIRQTLKKRREEISGAYDKEIGKAQDQLKKAKNKREKAKNQGMKERIADETSKLREDNRELRMQMKTVFKQNHVPQYCNSSLYYSLYFARGMKERMTFLMFVAIVFAAVPLGAYLLVPERKPLHLAIIYLVDILVCGGVYLKIGNRTKLQHMEALKEGRKILDQIRGNDKKIKAITSAIRKDRSDTMYDLETYDDEIAKFQQELDDVTSKKKEAMTTFETVTKTILQDEIESQHRENLEQLHTEYEQIQTQLHETAAAAKNQRLDITDRYATYLGKEFLDPVKIDELRAIVQAGNASSVSEAIAVYQTVSKE